VQLDRTGLAIRERNFFDLVDLSFMVLRRYFAPLMKATMLTVAPLWVLNFLLVDHLLRDAINEERATAAYIWLTLCLIIAEAPLVSILPTMYLGRIVFMDDPKLWEVMRDGIRLAPRWIWSLIFVRGIIWVWGVVFFCRTADEGTFIAWQFAMVFVMGVILLIRAIRPFVTEIIVLERNRLRARSSGEMTVSRRSGILHGPSGGDIFGRAIVSYLLASLLFGSLLASMYFLCKVLLQIDSFYHPLMLRGVYPLCLWMVAAYFTVLRFLSYLDIRIRHEGWEVELRLRAEAARLAKKLQ
jgi:hypothetical protein